MALPPAPDYLFDPKTRHMMVVAHQDDEINYTGLLQRLGPEMRFVWLTNGDGLAPFENADPVEYAEMRKAETDDVLKTLGRPLEMRECLDYSEIEIYDNFVDLTLEPQRRAEIMDFFWKAGCEVYKRIADWKPEVLWSGQFQNGHPEHDLTHFLSALSLRQLQKEDPVYKPAFYQLPEYEYTILIPLRFHPLYKGVVHEIFLTPEEMAKKEECLNCYPSQVKLFDKFRSVIGAIGWLGLIRGKRFDAIDYLSRETFGPVPEDIDYSKSFHVFEWANYMFDKNKNTKVRFDKHIREIYLALKDRPFKI